MRVYAWILSFLLHTAVAFAGVYLATPGAVHINLDVPVYQIDLVELKPKKGRAVKVRPKPVPKVEKARPAPPKPEPKPTAKEISAKPKPAEEIPAPAKPAEQKPAPKKPAQPQKTRDQLLKEALAHAQKDVKWLERKQRKEQERELADIRDMVAAADAMAATNSTDPGEEAGAGGEDEQGSFLSLVDIYAAQVKKIVKDNWRYPSIPVDAGLTAGVLIRVGPEGIIIESVLTASSGRPDFDTSVIKAIEETAELPPPPGDIREIRINFNLQDMR